MNATRTFRKFCRNLPFCVDMTLHLLGCWWFVRVAAYAGRHASERRRERGVAVAGKLRAGVHASGSPNAPYCGFRGASDRVQHTFLVIVRYVHIVHMPNVYAIVPSCSPSDCFERVLCGKCTVVLAVFGRCVRALLSWSSGMPNYVVLMLGCQWVSFMAHVLSKVTDNFTYRREHVHVLREPVGAPSAYRVCW